MSWMKLDDDNEKIERKSETKLAQMKSFVSLDGMNQVVNLEKVLPVDPSKCSVLGCERTSRFEKFVMFFLSSLDLFEIEQFGSGLGFHRVRFRVPASA
jgi:hypothetical protein